MTSGGKGKEISERTWVKGLGGQDLRRLRTRTSSQLKVRKRLTTCFV